MSRILLFDAYPSFREILAEELAADGSIVVPIGNPESLAGVVTAFEPDVFILDPYIRGGMRWELFDAVKEQNPKLPILLFTEASFPDPHFTQADGLLQKSYILDKLKQKIKETLQKRSSRKQDSLTISREV